MGGEHHVTYLWWESKVHVGPGGHLVLGSFSMPLKYDKEFFLKQYPIPNNVLLTAATFHLGGCAFIRLA